MRFIVTGGGTGGHLAIARAIGEALKSRGHEVMFVGSKSGQDRMWFENEGPFAERFFLETTGVVNQKGLKKLYALWKVFKALLKAYRIMKEKRADAVFSVGGFSAAPASLAALLARKPLFIHEQNAVSGRLNRLLRPRARAFFSSYDTASPVRDYPVSRVFFEGVRQRDRIRTIIFLGGSQGASFINDLALQSAAELQRRGIHIIHQCGERDFERVKASYAEQGVDAELYGFTKELPALLARSDLAVSRAGASTLWELCASGVPALFIPYPYAAGDHQYHNARFLAERSLGWVERQSGDVRGRLDALLDTDLTQVSNGVREMISPDGAENIVICLEEMLA